MQMRGALFVLAAALTLPITALAGQAQLPAPATPPAASLSTSDLGQVYVLYLRGRELAGRLPPDLRGAIASYRQALELAPNAADLRA